MASHPFDDLALRYVLADDEAVQISVARTTVEELETAATTTPPTIRNAIGQWVGSINRWLGSQPDDEDDVISRAKALGFLARTLEFLKRDLLKPDQVKLLIAFFCSLFSSDHKAGIEASSQALGYLMDMKAFQPTSGHDIINGIVQLGSDDFKRQTPGTRLQIYQLFRRLLDHTLVANDLAYRHGDASGFMLSLVELCSNERDPQNLVVWFEIQKLFLENFSPTKEVVDEVFKAFSAYFPITLRASATPSGITVEDLKRSLRSCFSSHYRVARLAVPFLLNKLDQGEAVTVSVKVDILQTLEACLARYSDVTQGISLYTDQIWSSLKYEVRNGEVQDSIEATLRTIATLAKRLDEKDLQTFFEAAWIDISDDVSNETYTESAGRLLTAIAGSSRRSFSLSVRQAIPHITTTFRNTTAATHQVKLLGTMNALLQVRMVLSKQGGTLALGDELFGDNFFDDVYARSWSAWTQSQYSNDRLGILKRLIEGMSYIVVQQSSDGHDQRLCSEATWNRVFSWLGTPSIIFPLEGKNFLLGSQETEYDEIVNSATRALSTLAPLYPAGYQQLLERFLGSITSMSEARGPSRSEEISLIAAGSRLAFIGFGTGDTRASSLQNTMILITVFLQGFYRMTGIASQYIRPLTDLIHLAIRKPITAVTKTLDNKEALPIFSQSIEHRDWFDSLTNQIDGLPEIDKGIVGDLSKMSASLSKSTHDTPVASYQQFLLFSLSVVTQLFRCTLCLKSLPSGTNVFIDITAAMEKATGPQPGGFLHQLGQMAATVIRTLNSEDQIKLDLAREVFLFFIEPSSGQTRDDILQSVAVVPGEGAKEKWSFFKGVIQTAPLSLGILQGLHPSAMQDLVSFAFRILSLSKLTDESIRMVF